VQSGRALKAVHGAKFDDGGTQFSVVGVDTAWRRMNGTWVADTIPAGNALRATYVTPQGDIWAGGDDGGGAAVLWLWSADGGGWAAQPSPTARGLTGMSGFGDVGPFVVGQYGVILRRAGADGG
jgi:hypothetical protein